MELEYAYTNINFKYKKNSYEPDFHRYIILFNIKSNIKYI